MSHLSEYRLEHEIILASMDWLGVEEMARELSALDGTLYIVGLGGSAANASHMSADFRKLANMDARSLDNVAELTAMANDEGWGSLFRLFLRDAGSNDVLFVLSVGGGTATVSIPLVTAIDIAKHLGMRVLGIVGPHGGYTASHGDLVIKIPADTNPTPHTEAFQAVLFHALVSHPLIQKAPMKWK